METIIEFGSAYSAVTGEYVGEYVPEVTWADGHPYVGGCWPSQSGWHVLHGHRYNGASSPIFEPAETASDEQIREWVRDAGGDVFAVVTVDDWSDAGYDDATGDRIDPEPVGWAVIYRNAGAVSA